MPASGGAPTVLSRPFTLGAHAGHTSVHGDRVVPRRLRAAGHHGLRPGRHPDTVRAESELSFKDVITLTLLRDTAYTLEVTAGIPYGTPTERGRQRRSELLSTIDVPAGTPGTRLTVTAPFDNCTNRPF